MDERKGTVSAVRESRVRCGNPKTLERDRSRLVRLAYRFLWNESDAEDVVQDALVQAEREHGGLRDESKWWSWLCRIVVRQCFALRRSEGRRTHRERLSADVRHRDGADADDGLRLSERAELVRWGIAQLPPQQRTAVTLRHLEEMSFERVAAIMEISPVTARLHVRAGRERLRELIDRGERGDV